MTTTTTTTNTEHSVQAAHHLRLRPDTHTHARTCLLRNHDTHPLCRPSFPPRVTSHRCLAGRRVTAGIQVPTSAPSLRVSLLFIPASLLLPTSSYHPPARRSGAQRIPYVGHEGYRPHIVVAGGVSGRINRRSHWHRISQPRQAQRQGCLPTREGVQAAS